MSSSLIRSLRNLSRVGFKDYIRQLNRIGDTKSGNLVGTDDYGNKYFENEHEDEIHLRTRWVEYKDYYGNVSSVEAGWHFWLAYGVDVAPNATAKEFTTVRAYPPPETSLHPTGTPGAYVPYNTVKPKVQSWTPVAHSRV